METKTAKFKRLFSEQKYHEALRIFKTFRKMLSPEEERAVSIAWECTTGKENFYKSLGINTSEMKSKAYQTMLNYVYPEQKK